MLVHLLSKTVEDEIMRAAHVTLHVVSSLDGLIATVLRRG